MELSVHRHRSPLAEFPQRLERARSRSCPGAKSSRSDGAVIITEGGTSNFIDGHRELGETRPESRPSAVDFGPALPHKTPDCLFSVPACRWRGRRHNPSRTQARPVSIAPASAPRAPAGSLRPGPPPAPARPVVAPTGARQRRRPRPFVAPVGRAPRPKARATTPARPTPRVHAAGHDRAEACAVQRKAPGPTNFRAAPHNGDTRPFDAAFTKFHDGIPHRPRGSRPGAQPPRGCELLGSPG